MLQLVVVQQLPLFSRFLPQTAANTDNKKTSAFLPTRPRPVTWRNLTAAELNSAENFRAVYVVAEYKLIFFPLPKVACSVFKKLLRRMMHIENWNIEGDALHYTTYNNLTELSTFPRQEWSRMLTGSDWTRVIFVRDPKERLLSAYLDKIVNERLRNGMWEYSLQCCSTRNKEDACVKQVIGSFQGFATAVRDECCCNNHHWSPQSGWMDNAKSWRKFINFVGHLETAATNTKEMLNRLSPEAWQLYGASGWGDDGNESVFGANTAASHSTGASSKFQQYFNTSEIHRIVEEIYADDYNLEIFGLVKKK